MNLFYKSERKALKTFTFEQLSKREGVYSTGGSGRLIVIGNIKNGFSVLFMIGNTITTADDSWLPLSDVYQEMDVEVKIDLILRS